MAQFEGMRLNEKFIDLMEQLASIMLKQGEPFRARAYQKAQETIMSYSYDIKSPNDLKEKPNIGSTIMEKLTEYFQTGTLQILEREKNNPINILSEVYGIGPKKAKELVDQGITTIEQLRLNQNLLNDNQKIGVKYYYDILKRIPRSEIEQYKETLNSVFETVCMSDSKFEIVGSYRRGAESSGDIDIIIGAEITCLIKQQYLRADIIDELTSSTSITAHEINYNNIHSMGDITDINNRDSDSFRKSSKNDNHARQYSRHHNHTNINNNNPKIIFLSFDGLPDINIHPTQSRSSLPQQSQKATFTSQLVFIIVLLLS